MLTLSQAIEAYLTSQARLLSPASIKMYRQSTGFLLKTFDGDQLIEDLDKYQLIKWRDSLFTARRFQGHPYIKNQDGRLSVHTIRRIIADCKAFFAWLVTVGLLESSPLAGVQKPKAPENAPKAISIEDFEKLLAVAGQYRGNKYNFAVAYQTRNTAIVLTLASTACRVGGLCSMRVPLLELTDTGAQIDVQEKGRGGGTTRTVYMSDTAALAILEWLDQRPACAHDYIFTGIEGKSAGIAMSPQAVRQMLNRLANRAGIEGKFNPHAFRHAAAREWLRNGADLQTVSQLLGHSDIRVTAKFYARWTQTELRDRHEMVDYTKSK